MLFKSFWMGGFEPATHITMAGARLDMLAATQHDIQAAHDYALLRSMGIGTARDALRWHLIERAGKFDFSSLLPMLQAARSQDMQIIWSLCHYGWPDDLDPASPAFVDRYARFCRAAAHFINEHSDGIPFYIPVNEISFLAWASGKIMHPGFQSCRTELKRNLARAVIAGCEAIWDITPQARIVHAEPAVNVVAPPDRPDLIAAAQARCLSQFESMDMLSGRLEPQLGGQPRYLDIIGVNYYHANQWEYPDSRLRWEDAPRDGRWRPLHHLLKDVYQRYRRPVFIAETSHFGTGRVRWLKEITEQVIQARADGVPVEGICIYPILDRPDWDNPQHWHNSGLWDLLPGDNGVLKRVLNEDYAAQVRLSQALLTMPSEIEFAQPESVFPAQRYSSAR